MFNSGIIANRHRNLEYYLNLNSSNRDHLFIPQSEKVFQVPSSGDYSYGVTMEVPVTSPSVVKGIIGYLSKGGTVNGRYGAAILSTGFLTVFSRDVSSWSVVDLIGVYGGQKIDLRVDYVGVEVIVYINNTEIDRITPSARPDVAIGNFFIGAYAESNGITIDGARCFNGKIYNFFIDQDIFNCNEGSGFSTFSDLGTEATGTTSNAGGLTYWNANVWTLIIP
jgi:hypothetical protein